MIHVDCNGELVSESSKVGLICGFAKFVTVEVDGSVIYENTGTL